MGYCSPRSKKQIQLLFFLSFIATFSLFFFKAFYSFDKWQQGCTTTSFRTFISPQAIGQITRIQAFLLPLLTKVWLASLDATEGHYAYYWHLLDNLNENNKKLRISETDSNRHHSSRHLIWLLRGRSGHDSVPGPYKVLLPRNHNQRAPTGRLDTAWDHCTSGPLMCSGASGTGSSLFHHANKKTEANNN